MSPCQLRLSQDGLAQTNCMRARAPAHQRPGGAELADRGCRRRGKLVIRMRTSSGEHLDVLIVGSGLSGGGAACQMQSACPELTYAVLEARDRIGGTWDLFRYP